MEFIILNWTHVGEEVLIVDKGPVYVFWSPSTQGSCNLKYYYYWYLLQILIWLCDCVGFYFYIGNFDFQWVPRGIFFLR